MKRLKYFVAVFGDPQPPQKTAVESGEYAPDPKYAPFEAEPGDVMLLYCTSSYPRFSMQIPGIGIVLSADSEQILYRWLPFNDAIAKSQIDKSFEPTDVRKFGNVRFSSHWLFEISQVSFNQTVEGQSINWDRVSN
jgi:hypothetical protein